MATILLGDIVQNIKEVVNPKTCGLDKFVGLEHYDAGEPMITRYGSPEKLDTNVKHFCKGDILVARRNVYLKRAGYVDFEGVTSGDSIVLRVTNPTYQRILPFILNTDDFWDYAEQNADGTMSKRLSPDDLLDYEFEEPEDKEVLAEKLWAAYKVKESYRQLISTTDEMLKAKFQEMLKGACKVSLGDVCFRITDGSHTPPQGINHSEYLMISAKNIDGVRLDLNDVRYLSQADFEKEHKRTKIKKDDVLLTIVGTIGRAYLMKGNEPNITLQRSVAVLTPNERIVPSFLYYSMSTDTEFEKEGQGNAQKGVYLAKLAKYQITLPDINMQKEFASIFTQAEATKASLRASIEAIDRVIRSLINQ